MERDNLVVDEREPFRATAVAVDDGQPACPRVRLHASFRTPVCVRSLVSLTRRFVSANSRLIPSSLSSASTHQLRIRSVRRRTAGELHAYDSNLCFTGIQTRKKKIKNQRRPVELSAAS